MSQVDKDKCPTCQEKLKRNAEILLCCVCTYSYHPECEEVADEVYKTIKSEMDSGILWCCKKCKLFGNTVVDLVNHLSSELKKTNKTLEAETNKRKELENSIKNLKDRVSSIEEGNDETKLEEKSKTFAEAALKKYKEEFPSIEKSNVTKIVDEKIREIKDQKHEVNIDAKLEEAEQRIREDQREIEIRKKNCIIHNLKELESEDKDEKKEADIEAVEKFMNSCGVDEIRPVFYTRLGTKPQDANKARPLKVIFESEDDKITLVKKYCNTKRYGTPDQKESIGEITMVPDRTIKEREEYKKLKNELEERTKKGEKNLVIRNFKIRQKQ